MPFGFDLDDVLGYYTPKYVKIRDWRLGALQKGMMLAILFKICAYNLVYNCTHLLEIPVTGSANAGAQPPTLGSCNPLDDDCFTDFTPLSKLKYCLQYDKSFDFQPVDTNGKEEKDTLTDTKDPEEDGSEKGTETPKRTLVGAPTLQQRNCIYRDAAAMSRGKSAVPGVIFLPTRLVEIKQTAGCLPNESNGYACKTKPWIADGKDYQKFHHIADVERFTLLVNQAFHAEGFKHTGRSDDFAGFAKGRPDLQDFYTKSKGFVNRLEKDEADELKVISKDHEIPHKPDPDGAFKSALALSVGDVFSVADLLRMADLRGADLLDEVREDGSTLRSAGGVISIDIEYSNKKTFDYLGTTVPHYTISAKFIPMNSYKMVYEDTVADGKRTVHDVHGLLFIISVTGSVRTFNCSQLLTVLTTALVALAMAGTLTDIIMSYTFALSAHYNLLKYQPTMDFSDLRKRVGMLQAKYNDGYSPEKHKSSATAHVVAEAAKKQGRIDDESLLAVICSFEQRLNRIDGVDPYNATGHDENDACSSYVKNHKNNFMSAVAGLGDNL